MRPDGLRARFEERDRLAVQEAVDVLGVGGRFQRGDGIDTLGRETKRSAACHQQLYVGCGCGDLCDGWRSREDVLEVVEHEQEFAAS